METANEVIEVAQTMPVIGWLVLLAFGVFLAYRVGHSKARTGTFTGGVFSGGGGGRNTHVK